MFVKVPTILPWSLKKSLCLKQRYVDEKLLGSITAATILSGLVQFILSLKVMFNKSAYLINSVLFNRNLIKPSTCIISKTRSLMSYNKGIASLVVVLTLFQ